MSTTSTWDPGQLKAPPKPLPSAALGFAYLLWLLGGMIGVHRFYLGKTGSAVAMFGLFISVIGTLVALVWWVVDLFLLSGMFAEVTTQEDIR